MESRRSSSTPRQARPPRPTGPVRRRLGRGLAILTILLLLVVNWRAHHPGDLGTVAAQLRYPGPALERGAGESMQRLFPEGLVFTWSLYGLAAAQVARQLPESDPRRAECLERARRAVERVDSDTARQSFDPELGLPYGAFYIGWSLYLRAEYLRAVGIAALALHDRLLTPAYGATIALWLEGVRARLDPELGVMGHAADPETGGPLGGVRGSSLALVSRLPAEAAPELAREHYRALRRHFVTQALGAPGVREFARGRDGAGDVDSGPLILGFSGPALVVGAAAGRAHGDEALARQLLCVVEVAGAPIEIFGRRAYAFGLLPVGDAFIAWARSTPPGPPPRDAAAWPACVPVGWALPWHAGSVVLGALCLLAARRSRR